MLAERLRGLAELKEIYGLPKEVKTFLIYKIFLKPGDVIKFKNVGNKKYKFYCFIFEGSLICCHLLDGHKHAQLFLNQFFCLFLITHQKLGSFIEQYVFLIRHM